MAKEWAKAFYNSTAWQQARGAALKRDRYTCQTEGCFHVAEEVHHKIELTPENINNKRIALGMDNLVSLCGQCHKQITKAEHEKSNTGSVKLQRIVFDENGYPVKPPRG